MFEKYSLQQQLLWLSPCHVALKRLNMLRWLIHKLWLLMAWKYKWLWAGFCEDKFEI